MIEHVKANTKAFEESEEFDQDGMEYNSNNYLGTFIVHALVDYSNPQIMQVGCFIKSQPMVVLIDMGSG